MTCANLLFWERSDQTNLFLQSACLWWATLVRNSFPLLLSTWLQSSRIRPSWLLWSLSCLPALIPLTVYLNSQKQRRKLNPVKQSLSVKDREKKLKPPLKMLRKLEIGSSSKTAIWPSAGWELLRKSAKKWWRQQRPTVTSDSGSLPTLQRTSRSLSCRMV